MPSTSNADEIAKTAQAYVDALLSDNTKAAALAPDLQQAEIEQLRETLRAVAAGRSVIRMTIPVTVRISTTVSSGDQMLVASDPIKPTVASGRFKDALQASRNNAIRVVLRLSARNGGWVVTDLDLIPDTAVRMPEWGSGLVRPG